MATASRWRTTRHGVVERLGDVVEGRQGVVVGARLRVGGQGVDAGRASPNSSFMAGSTCSARIRSKGTRKGRFRRGLLSNVSDIPHLRLPGVEPLAVVRCAIIDDCGEHSKTMGIDPNGGSGAHPAAVRPSLYALVIYLPPELGTFLDRLRLEMVPGCSPHAHVSVLPPRPLPVAPEAAIAEARRIVAEFPPFEIQLGPIEIFQKTDVIFISVDQGMEQLRQMHGALNRGALAFDEPFAYHPHVTLAQELQPGQVEPLRELAERKWRAFPGERRFRADHSVFVRNTHGRLWVDLADGPLLALPVG